MSPFERRKLEKKSFNFNRPFEQRYSLRTFSRLLRTIIIRYYSLNWRQFFFFFFNSRGQSFLVNDCISIELRAIDVINYPFVGIADTSFARIAH